MDAREIRLRCIEAAAKNPTPDPEGYAAGVQKTAAAWAEWVAPVPTTTVPVQGTIAPRPGTPAGAEALF